MAEKVLIANIKGPKGDPGQGLPTGGTMGHVLIKKSDDDFDYDWADFDASADFLIENGFGKLRYYDNKFQYYDTTTSSWIDTVPTMDNSVFMELAPANVRKFVTVCNPETLNIEIKLEEPKDTIVDNQAFCMVKQVIVRRKKESFPTNENDGDHVFTVYRNEFGKYKDKPFIDEVNGDIDDVYYYKAFPISNNGVVNYMDENDRKCVIKNYQLYGFKIDQNEGEPNTMIQYLDDVDNANFIPASMDYINDKFYYGDWEDAWFIKKLKPCMLNYDGTVAYELDKNDYSKKLDGSPSDITNDNFEGNAMIGFPKIYWKIVDNGDNTVNVYLSDYKLDDDYVCWCNINELGEEIDYFYVAIYNSSLINSKIRSLSGKTMDGNHYFNTDFTNAQKNNIDTQKAWNIELFVDKTLISLLLALMGKSTDTQTVFGYGYPTYGGKTGELDKKGMFYGGNTSISMKVFGIENYWGNKYRYIAGYLLNGGKPKIKLTHGTLDGSTTEGYNTTGDGYIEMDAIVSSAGYISKMMFSNNIMLPSETQGSATTKYCDYYVPNNTGVRYPVYGSYNNNQPGAFYANFNSASSSYDAAVGSRLSCKPLNQTPQEV